MRVIRNKLIPFKGFNAINILGVLFIRPESVVTEYTVNHESIHSAQMKEMLYIFFYLWYLVEWVIKLFIYGKRAYRNISFEREAYTHTIDFKYLEKRKPFAFIKLL